MKKSKEQKNEFKKALKDAKEERKKEAARIKGYPSLKKIFGFYKGHWGELIAVAIIGAIASGFSVLSPIYFGKVISNLTNYNIVGHEPVVKYLIISSSLILFTNLIWRVWSLYNNKIFFKISIKIKNQYTKSLLSLKTENFDKTSSGIFTSRIKDCNEVAVFLIKMSDYVAEFLSSTFFVFYIAYLNIYFGALCFVYIIFRYVSKRRFENIRYVRRKKINKMNEEKTGYYNEIVRGVRDVKGLSLKSAMQERAEIKEREIFREDYSFNKVWALHQFFVQFVNVLYEAIFIVLGLILLYYKEIELGIFVMIFYYRYRATSMANFISLIFEGMRETEFSAEKIFEIIDASDDKFTHESFGNINLENIKGELEFKKVCFEYKENEEVLSNVSFKVKPNEIVGIVGKSGGGKSTIMSLANRFYDIKSGEILIDKVNVNNLNEESLRRAISIVTQNPYIFNVTIKENLRLVKNDATEKELIEACKKAQIHEFFAELKDGYNTIIGENGVVLSGGQKQRLAIARAILKESKIIMFDESTSSLDNESQAKIKTALNELSKNHTIVIVAHRLSTIVDCDKIFVIENKKVEASGKHKDLLEKSEIYKGIYDKEQN